MPTYCMLLATSMYVLLTRRFVDSGRLSSPLAKHAQPHRYDTIKYDVDRDPTPSFELRGPTNPPDTYLSARHVAQASWFVPCRCGEETSPNRRKKGDFTLAMLIFAAIRCDRKIRAILPTLRCSRCVRRNGRKMMTLAFAAAAYLTKAVCWRPDYHV